MKYYSRLFACYFKKKNYNDKRYAFLVKLKERRWETASQRTYAVR
jgi:hypothetical protein